MRLDVSVQDFSVMDMFDGKAHLREVIEQLIFG